jgi:hypothetical protein
MLVEDDLSTSQASTMLIFIVELYGLVNVLLSRLLIIAQNIYTDWSISRGSERYFNHKLTNSKSKTCL